MQRRLFPIALLATLAVVGCADQVPTLAEDREFPTGAVPATREVLLPASEFFELLGAFSGFHSIAGAAFQVVANDFEGLDAHGLNRFPSFPREVAYRRDGTDRRDSLFRYEDSRIVMRVDTTASTGGPVTLRVYAAAEAWHPPTATWTSAVDTGGVATPWTEPGGTRGALLGEGTYPGPGGADTVVVPITAASVALLADSASHGVVITLAETGQRVELSDVVVRALVRPDSAAPDTVITVTVGSSGFRTTVYTPEQPEPPPGIVAVGGVRGARTLVRIDPRQTVPGCAEGETCARVPLSQVRINQVTVVFRPAPVPSGFDPLGRVPISVRMVQEPELGRFAPLGPPVADREVPFSVRDTLLEIPITGLAASMAIQDTFPVTFALVSESPVTQGPPTFGVAFLEGDPVLRIVYTLPTRRRLP
jgi:hypothetical protein